MTKPPSLSASVSASREPHQEAARRVSDWVAEQLLQRIAGGELVPGQRLPGERQMAEQLGVSRVSVRAALQQLKTQGFLTAVQGGGTRVVSSAGAMDPALCTMVKSTLNNLYDLADIRMALETWAARRAAERATPQQLAELKTVLETLGSTTDPQKQADDDMDFHVQIARAACSPVYLHIFSTIRDILDGMVAIDTAQPFVDGQRDLILGHHRAIYDGIAGRNPDAAAAAVAEHLDWVISRYHAIRDEPETEAK
jgi:GntR family transcriptional regulator, transcriptional repressor for pyruvate dehydrogenase complex